VRYVLEHSESRALFVGKLDGFAAVAAGIPRGLPLIALPLGPTIGGGRWEDIVATTEPLAGEPDRSLDDLATIVYTSGSTGKPKGVMQSFRSFNVVGTLMQGTVNVGPDDRMLSYLPLAHVAERVAVENQSTYFGFQVFFAESQATFVEDLRRARPTIFFSVPRLWTKFHLAVRSKISKRKERVLFRVPVVGRSIKRRILEQLGLESVRMAFTGAAPLPPDILAWYRSLGLELIEAYGMSENMAYSHMTRAGGARPGYVGHSNEGVECRIGDGAEVLVKSPAQMMGYYKDPEKTAESYTPDGFFRTGDMGELDEEGRLRITGRVKDLFKTSKGKYVAPVPIENRLGAHHRIEAVCVAGANQPATFALVLLSEDTRNALLGGAGRADVSAELAALISEVNEKLEPHEQLAFAVVVSDPWTVESGLLTPTVKIRRDAIEKHYEPHVEGWFSRGEKVIWQASAGAPARASRTEPPRRIPTPPQQ
jgi:long-subunit acyl-CoA synthetase (AMP-forming)